MTEPQREPLNLPASVTLPNGRIIAVMWREPSEDYPYWYPIIPLQYATPENIDAIWGEAFGVEPRPPDLFEVVNYMSIVSEFGARRGAPIEQAASEVNLNPDAQQEVIKWAIARARGDTTQDTPNLERLMSRQLLAESPLTAAERLETEKSQLDVQTTARTDAINRQREAKRESALEALRETTDPEQFGAIWEILRKVPEKRGLAQPWEAKTAEERGRDVWGTPSGYPTGGEPGPLTKPMLAAGYTDKTEYEAAREAASREAGEFGVEQVTPGPTPVTSEAETMAAGIEGGGGGSKARYEAYQRKKEWDALLKRMQISARPSRIARF